MLTSKDERRNVVSIVVEGVLAVISAVLAGAFAAHHDWLAVIFAAAFLVGIWNAWRRFAASRKKLS